MRAADGRPCRSLAALAVGLALVLGGCAAPRACYCRNASAAAPYTSAYTVAAPDAVELAVARRPDLAGRAAIDPDGTIPLGSDGRLRIEGLTVAEVADKLAAELHVSPAEIQIHVAEYASRQVFLCGPVAGTERAIPYQGPEPVVEFLRRIGGLSREAEPRDVHVVRANVAAGRRPEVFQVDLKAILIDKDDKTNVLLQPYDQVYVGESARATWEKCLPPWMQFGRQQAAGSGQ
jgi:polysaccharide biosynthesis/export protein